jgi:SAM-dependent methyltransferase
MAKAANSSVNPYDEIPYPDLSYVQTHPDRMATLAHILGLPAKSSMQCRVLELGCAAGGNLLPMAVNLPDCDFVGIDYSPTQIEMGQQRIETLGIGNLRLACMDVTQPEELGSEFDYIIAHGLYSWVERPVRDAMFRLCKRVLAPHGILFVSYNTLPGWRITGIVREAMLFHARNAADLQEKARLAKEMLAFLAESVPDEHESYRAIFRRYRNIVEEGIKGANEAFFLHDELEEVNEPVYFCDFVEHAAGFGLKYFVESELSTVLPHVFGAEAVQKLQMMATTPVELEQ